MTTKKTTIIFTVAASLILFILTLTQYGNLLELLLPKIENLHYQTVEHGSIFKHGLFFTIIIGLLPAFLYLTWRLARIEILNRRIISTFVVMLCMVLAILLRQQLIKSTLKGITNIKTQSGEPIYNSLTIENLHFEYYVLIGLILGCILSFITLRAK